LSTQPDQEPAIPDQLYCQTEGCPNPISVVMTRLEDHEADMLCMTCCMAFWTAVLGKVAQRQDTPAVAETADPG
jgi:hypothetical protein